MSCPGVPPVVVLYVCAQSEKEMSDTASKRVSVVIPCYRGEKFIARAINSIDNHCAFAVEVIVVEDGVYDDTHKILEQFSKVKHLSYPENKGAPYARNLGLQNVTTEYVMFLDCDDEIEPPLIEELANELDRTGADLGFGPQKSIHVGSMKTGIKRPPDAAPFLIACNWLAGFYGPNPSAIMWRTASVRRIGGWQEALIKNQDGELVVRALLSNLVPCAVHKGAGVYHIHHQGTIRTSSDRKALDSHLLVAKMVEDKFDQLSEDDRKKLSAALRFYYLGRLNVAAKVADWELIRFWVGKISRPSELLFQRYAKRPTYFVMLFFLTLHMTWLGVFFVSRIQLIKARK